jgi:Ca2+:H+ antiporter
LFVLPLLVLVGIPMGRYLHLSLPPVALAALAIAIVMIGRITDNRNVNWYEGVQLIVLLTAMATGALLLVKP